MQQSAYSARSKRSSGTTTTATSGSSPEPGAEWPCPAFVSASRLAEGSATPGSAGPSTRSGSGSRTPSTGGSAAEVAATTRRANAELRRSLSQSQEDKKAVEDALARSQAKV